MTDNEKKAWEAIVEETSRPASMRPYAGHVRIDPKLILAAEAELKRLREAIEWAATLPGSYTDQVFRSNGYWCMFRDDLRRRSAK